MARLIVWSFVGVLFAFLSVYFFSSSTIHHLPPAAVLEQKYHAAGGITRSDNPVAKMQEVAYVILERSEDRINITSSFFSDFGLSLLPSSSSTTATATTLYYRAYGSHHHSLEIRRGIKNSYLGVGVLVSTLGEFASLAKLGVKKISSSEAGGGDYIELTDPDGFLIEVRLASLWSSSPPLPLSPPTLNNLPRSQQRPVNSLHRPIPGPPQIEKLAHCVTQVRTIISTIKWYVETLGLIVSDMQFLIASGESSDPAYSTPTIAFLRPNKGASGAPHHALALVSTVGLGFEHCAFEVSDLDTIGNGQRWLQMRAASGLDYRHAWGIGRHVLGSNLFDYWREGGADEMFEHTSDVDLLDSNASTGFGPMTPSAQHLFGPDLPSAFVRPLHLVQSALSRLSTALFTTGSLRDGDLSLTRIAALIRSISPSMMFKEY